MVPCVPMVDKGLQVLRGFYRDGLYRFVVMCDTPGKSTDAIMRAIEKRID